MFPAFPPGFLPQLRDVLPDVRAALADARYLAGQAAAERADSDISWLDAGADAADGSSPAAFTGSRHPGERDFPMFWSATRLARSGRLDAAAEAELITAALQAGLYGTEAEVRHVIEAARRYARRTRS